MALWAAEPAGREARPWRNQKPAIVATITTATAEASSQLFFWGATVVGASLTCSGATVAREAEPEVLAAGGGADSIGGGVMAEGGGGGAASTIALLPDSVSRFSLWRSVRMSAACW